MFTAVAALSVQTAQAYTITLEQMGANVVATGSGAINLTGVTLFGGVIQSIGVQGNPAFIRTGGSRDPFVSGYMGFTGPASIGPGTQLIGVNHTSGDPVGVDTVPNNSFILVPEFYVSGTALSSSATWNNATFASLGVTPGTYVWSWGTGLPNQNFTLIIGGAVPDGGSTVFLLGCALLGLTALRRKLGC